MPLSHTKLNLSVDVTQLQKQLADNEHLFGTHNNRFACSSSPHREVTDIWVRFNDIQPYLDGEKDMSTFVDYHDSVWYPAVNDIASVVDIVFQIMSYVRGERLGGVLITKLDPHGQVYPHVDNGWHAEYYDKFYVPIVNKPGACFYFEDGTIDPQEGDVYQFDNSYQHWVRNDSDSERIALIVCIKHSSKIGE